MKKWIYITVVLLGWAMGTALVRTMDRFSPDPAGSGDSHQLIDGRAGRPLEPVGVRIGRMISGESGAMNESVPVNQALDMLFAERKSH